MRRVWLKKNKSVVYVGAVQPGGGQQFIDIGYKVSGPPPMY